MLKSKFSHLVFIICLFCFVSNSAIYGAETTSNLIVEVENQEAGAVSNYTLQFHTTMGEYAKINKGELVITIPEGFDISTLDSVKVYDDYTHMDYAIRRIENLDQTISIFLRRDKIIDEYSDVYPSDSSAPLEIFVFLSSLTNPDISGDYFLSVIGLRENQKIAFGPFLSEPFTIISAPIDSIAITPAGDIFLQAGDSQSFSAVAFDSDGQIIENVDFIFSLVDCTNCIGMFTDSILSVTRTGEAYAKVTAQGAEAFSGLITVHPGELSRMELQIGETQVVGTPLDNESAIILYDAFNNLKYDYDLTESPIFLNTSQGELFPSELNSNEFQFGGVVRLADYNILYQGNSGNVLVDADNGVVYSNSESVYFNNYDIENALNISGETISVVFANHQTFVNVLVRNNGNVKAIGEVTLSSYYVSSPDEITETTFVPSNTGQIDQVDLSLPINHFSGVTDELVVISESMFDIGGDFYYAADTQSYQIDILETSVLTFVENSLKPDTIMNKREFSISFAIDADGLTQSIDSALLVVSILDPTTNEMIVEIFQGAPVYDSFVGGIISYQNIPGLLNINSGFENGFYPVRFDYQLYSAGNLLTLENQLVDSIYIFFETGLSLIEGSLSPKVVYAGTNVSFEFTVNLLSDVPYGFCGVSSSFRIFDYNYSSSTNLILDTDYLMPGENKLRSAVISIQPEQLGKDLLAEAKFLFCIPGLHDTLTFLTRFTAASLPIEVRQLPTAQIIDLKVLAPNSPKVNCSQQIQFACILTNLSADILNDISLNLISVENESEILNPIQNISGVNPFDTVEVLFDVIASSQSNLLPESFRVDILSDDIAEIPPVDNSAFLFIEDPAQLEINYRVNGIENIDGLIVNQGDMINISFEMSNYGSASVTDGMYQFISSGLSLLPSDTVTGQISPDSMIDFSFIAPRIDTSLFFEFSLTSIPLDVNSSEPAVLLNNSFDFSILIISATAELIVEPAVSQSNLLLPGRPKDIISLAITNSGSSQSYPIQLESIDFSVFTPNYNEIDTRSIIDVNNTGFYDGDLELTSSTAGGNSLVLWFDDLQITPQETKTISLIVDVKESQTESFILELLKNNVKAVYADGPNSGQPVSVSSLSGGNEIVSMSLVIKGNTLKESFIIDNNPCNPEESPITFSYELKKDSYIEFRVFTLTGEEVYSVDYPVGSEGASSGENMIQWDGQNNSGVMVLNGVYIASILNRSTGEYARLKIAVVK